MDQHTLARTEAIAELSAALIRTAGEVLTRHGNDPQGPILVAAGFALALQTIGREIDENILATVCKLLSSKSGG